MEGVIWFCGLNDNAAICRTGIRSWNRVGKIGERARKRAPTRNLSTFGYVDVHEHVQVHGPYTLSVTVSVVPTLSRKSSQLDVG
jgi:hypothetical protein